MIEIEWEPHDKSEHGYVTAEVISLVQTSDLMVVQFKGKAHGSQRSLLHRVQPLALRMPCRHRQY